MTLKKIIVCVSAALLIPQSAALAQDPPAQKKTDKAPPSARVYLVALGPEPKRRFSIPNRKEQERLMEEWKQRNEQAGIPEGAGREGQVNQPIDKAPMPNFGEAKRLPPLPGTVPLSKYQYKVRKKRSEIKGPDDEPFRWQFINCSLNKTSGAAKVEAGVSLQLYAKPAPGEEPEKAFSLPALPPYSQNFVFMVPRKITKKSWAAPPRLFPVSIQEERFEGKSVYLKNFSNTPVVVQIGNHKAKQLAPGDEAIYALESGKTHGLSALAQTASGTKVLVRTGFRSSANSFRIVAFYPANPATNAGMTVGTYNKAYSRIAEKTLAQDMEQR